MATGIPTFRVDISEGMIDVDTSSERLYAYCIEADRGPVNTPRYVASNNEAQRIFGKKNADFAPHFYQNPTGLVINRVGFEDMKYGSRQYKGTINSAQKVLMTVTAKYPGPCKHKVKITRSIIGKGLNLVVDIDEITSKSYQNIKTLKLIAQKIKDNFGDFLEVKLSSDYNETSFDNANFIDDTTGTLDGGSNGVMLNGKGEKTTTDVDNETEGLNGTSDDWKVTASMTEVEKETAKGKANPEQTRIEAYRKGFEKTAYVDVIGVAALSDQSCVRTVLKEHIEHMTDPEVHSFRFGITSVLDSDFNDPTERTETEITTVSQDLDNEWIICIGQGVMFKEDTAEEARELKPYKAIELYTGIRSALGYSEAIFGGEQKKILRGVVDTVPVISDGTIITKEEIINLNEAGVCTFKKEYDEITFVEGVTTLQKDGGKHSDVMTYENLMSIIAYVTKRLVVIAKPYQGQRLTEDLKTTLQTALAAELRNITESDGTLMALEEFNIPPYDVQVYSAAKTKFDDAKRLVRESKIIIQCRIVPVGALRDIDLHVIAI
jgi:hypothetical protein